MKKTLKRVFAVVMALCIVMMYSVTAMADSMKNHTHNYAIVVSDTASCTEDGIKTLKCNFSKNGAPCESIKRIESKAKGHTEEEIPAVEATCTKAGSTAGKKCSVCGDILEEPETVEAKGHTEVEIPAVEATCTKAGSTAGKKCSVCGDILVEQEVIEKKSHTETKVEGKDSTCTEKGMEAGSICSVCNAIISGCKELAALEHDYDEDGNCTRCDEVAPYTVSYKYLDSQANHDENGGNTGTALETAHGAITMSVPAGWDTEKNKNQKIQGWVAFPGNLDRGAEAIKELGLNSVMNEKDFNDKIANNPNFVQKQGKFDPTKLGENVENITFVAVWTKAVVLYSVSYLPGTDDTTVSNMPENITGISEGATQTVSSSIPTRTGYTFKEWTADPDVTIVDNSFTMPATDVTFTANWDINSYEYTVNYYKTGTEEKIKDSKTANAEFGTTITSADEVVTINGYTYDSASIETITIAEEGNVINLYYTQNPETPSTPGTSGDGTTVGGNDNNDNPTVDSEGSEPPVPAEPEEDEITGDAPGSDALGAGSETIDSDAMGDPDAIEDDEEDVDADALGTKTGDSTDVVPWAVGFGAALVLLGGAVALRRREN